MTSDSGSNSQDTDYARHLQEVLDELRQMQQRPQLVTSPDALEALEREIRQRTDRLGSLLVGQHLQQALDSDTLQAEQEQLVRQWPKPLRNDGKVTVMVRTVQGLAVPVRLTYYSILKFFQVDIIGMFRMTSSARYRKDGVGSSRPNWR